jgi:uncharacterized protein YbjT (DUF2867 family)
VVVVDYADRASLAKACEGATCVVSALAGLRDVIIHAQTALLDAAVAAGCKRFIPSDFSIDFTKQPAGWNRNLDLRREFHRVLEQRPIVATSIFNGAFADLLTGSAPFILSPLRRVLYWENPEQKLDFTTRDDVAAFTAEAALDPTTPRYLRIAGHELSATDLAELMTDLTGMPFRLFRAGSLRRLEKIIQVTRRVFTGRDQLNPAWQGMQDMHDMYAGRGKLEPLDNARYSRLRWTHVHVHELLAEKAPWRARAPGGRPNATAT